MSNRSDKATTRRLSLVNAAIFAPMGLHMPFFPAWLAAQGFVSSDIGLILALPPLVRVWSAPMLSRIADQRRDLAGMLAVCSLGVAASLLATGLLGNSFWMIAAIVMLTAFAWGPVIALSDSLALGIIAQHKGMDYGRIRLWGSVSFMIATLVGGWFLDQFTAANLIWLIGGLAAASACVVLVLVGGMRNRVGLSAPSLPTHGQRRSWPAVIGLIFGAVLIQGSHAFLYGFGTLSWRHAGLSGDMIGVLWAVGVLAEIAFFAMVGRYATSTRRGFLLIVIGGLAAMLRWMLLGLSLPALFLLPVQALHALTFAGTHVGTMLLLNEISEAGDRRATLQGWYGGASAAETALLSWLSGQLFSRFGSAGFLAMTLIAALGVLCVCIAWRTGFRPAPRAGAVP